MKGLRNRISNGQRSGCRDIRHRESEPGGGGFG